MKLMFIVEWIFYSLILAIYACNIGELMGHKIAQKDTNKTQLGIDLVQMVIVSSFTILLILKGALK